jgi:diguanylate cyclase (GGDEF)-like protein
MSILKRRNRELEAMVAKRTEDLRSANDQLSHMATHEPLTGLLNRRAITDRLTAELQPGGRPNRQFGVVLVDLNKFKPVNDTLGHNAGDQVLREMAGRIQGCLRDSDVLGRWGGDEFLVLMPGSDWEAVSAVCRRISQLEYPAVAESSSITVTASCGGVAVPGRTAVAPAAVLAAADELMYKVKRAGGRSFEVRVYEVRESRPDIEHPPRAAATSLGPEMQPEG